MAGVDDSRTRIRDWLHAQIAAVHLAFLGTGARRPRSLHYTGTRPAYTRQEVIAVMIELRRVFAVWLISGEYFKLAELLRRAALQLGQPEPRLPSMTPLTSRQPPTVPTTRSALADFRHETHTGRLHPVAASWWTVVRSTSEADRRLIFQALRRATRSKRSHYYDVMLSAIQRCHDETGTYPSYRHYEAWRSAQDDPSEWPTAASIRSVHRSWRQPLIDASIEPAADILVHRLQGRQDSFTPEEILTGIDQAAEDWRATHPGEPFRVLDYQYRPPPYARRVRAGPTRPAPTRVTKKLVGLRAIHPR